MAATIADQTDPLLQRFLGDFAMWVLDNKTPYGAERNWIRDKEGGHLWVVAVKATFQVGPRGALKLADQQQPPVLAPEHSGEPGKSSLKYDSDLLAAKPGTDLVVHGWAHAPGGRPASKVGVRLRAGAGARGVATAVETRPIKGDADCLGEGLAKAVGAAAASLKLPREAIDAVYCDINGERYRTEEWGLAYLRRQHLFKTAGYNFWAASCGDVGAASGALACVLAVQSWQRKYAEGPRALVCAGSESGVRGAAILEESES